VAERWVEAACTAKRIPPGSAARAEDMITGPVSLLRYLQLLVRTMKDIRRSGQPRLPGRVRSEHGQLRVPVFPARGLFDALLFNPIKAETWLQHDVPPSNIFGDHIKRVSGDPARQAAVIAVMGAGNVSAIPVTDALTKILQESSAVLLKMNPVNDYLGECFAQALAPLVDRGYLRIAYGGAEVGSYAVKHDGIGGVHLTGSIDTHDVIVWGADADERERRRAANEPALHKPVTSELGNVSPWIVVPGDYSDRQLRYQAENIAASITNNASFNCIATKVLITWKRWPARTRFLELVERILNSVPRRYAYYPGALERFATFSGRATDDIRDGLLPWTLLRDTDIAESPHLFERESFVCVCAETDIDADTPEAFLERAVDFVNDRLCGTLAAALTVPPQWLRRDHGRLDEAVRQLRYGTIGINQWPALSYMLMSTPWGGFPGADLRDAQSGIGSVHNTYLLDRPEKTVLRSPLTISPKPLWFSTHRNPEALAWKLFALYSRPGITRLPAVFAKALRG
jgi:acyl-CoA reductase-like NAD-dependent aldehyde dehydrogenase